MVLYSPWKLQVLIVVGVLVVGAMSDPKGVAFVQPPPPPPPQEVQEMAVVQQMDAVPHAAFVL
jgi:hypothetical protein